jgi:hypothetical protein
MLNLSQNNIRSKVTQYFKNEKESIDSEIVQLWLSDKWKGECHGFTYMFLYCLKNTIATKLIEKDQDEQEFKAYLNKTSIENKIEPTKMISLMTDPNILTTNLRNRLIEVNKDWDLQLEELKKDKNVNLNQINRFFKASLLSLDSPVAFDLRYFNEIRTLIIEWNEKDPLSNMEKRVFNKFLHLLFQFHGYQQLGLPIEQDDIFNFIEESTKVEDSEKRYHSEYKIQPMLKVIGVLSFCLTNEEMIKFCEDMYDNLPLNIMLTVTLIDDAGRHVVGLSLILNNKKEKVLALYDCNHSNYHVLKKQDLKNFVLELNKNYFYNKKYNTTVIHYLVSSDSKLVLEDLKLSSTPLEIFNRSVHRRPFLEQNPWTIKELVKNGDENTRSDILKQEHKSYILLQIALIVLISCGSFGAGFALTGAMTELVPLTIFGLSIFCVTILKALALMTYLTFPLYKNQFKRITEEPNENYEWFKKEANDKANEKNETSSYTNIQQQFMFEPISIKGESKKTQEVKIEILTIKDENKNKNKEVIINIEEDHVEKSQVYTERTPLISKAP